MEYQQIERELVSILEEKKGIYRTAYQICKKIETQYPSIWNQLLVAYPVETGNPKMGAGAGIAYSPANFVAKALDYIRQKDSRIMKGWIESENTTFEGITPGYPEMVSIWMMTPIATTTVR